MIDTKNTTIDELFDSGRLQFRQGCREAAMGYVYLDGYCVGTMWVEFDDGREPPFGETCFDPHYKYPDELANIVGKGNWSKAKEALAMAVIKETEPEEVS